MRDRLSLWLANCSTLFNLLKQLLALIRTAGVGHVPLVVAVLRWRQNQFEIIEIENRNLRRAIPLFFIWLVERKNVLSKFHCENNHTKCAETRQKVQQDINYAVFLMRRGKFNISFLMSRCVAFEARACFPPPQSALKSFSRLWKPLNLQSWYHQPAVLYFLVEGQFKNNFVSRVRCLWRIR